MNGRPWTSQEKAHVRRHYRKKTAREIAADLGRSVSCVHKRAADLGLTIKRRGWTDAMTRRLRWRHGLGWTDVQIAKEIGLSREWISEQRRKLGLPVNTETIRRIARQNVKKQLRTLGLSSPTELRTRAYRNFAKENGWPEDLRPREVQVLNALAAQGVPMTRQELAAAIGMRSDPGEYARGQRNLLCGNGKGGTYTASLARRGLVTILPHSGPLAGGSGKGSGRRVSLYLLGPAALAILEARAQCETAT